MVSIASPEAYRLLHEGCEAFTGIECNGIRVDVARLDSSIIKVDKRIKYLEEQMREDDVYKVWRRRYGQNLNFESREQLGNVLFKDMGFESKGYTAAGEAGGRFKINEEILETIELPFVALYLQKAKLEKLGGTYLKGVRREVVGDRIHPFYNLNTVITYRSSCDSPNFQNIPIRDKRIAKWIRSCIIASKGHRFLEIDFKGAEVCCAACYHNDPTMLKFLWEGFDMHKEMAAKCYMIPLVDVPKTVRQEAKSLFVFAQFYGDWYKSCAKALWETIKTNKLVTKDGKSLYEHLRKMGIEALGACDPKKDPVPGTFEHHIKKVEEFFWNKWFPVYKKWKQDHFNTYQKKGYFKTLTGFLLQGPATKNAIINYPIQGSAFHWNLWVLIRLHKWLVKYKMKSMVVGQIHDSMEVDTHEDELEDVVAKVQDLIHDDLRRQYPWIVAPVEVEAALAPAGGSWWDKVDFDLKVAA